MTVFFVLNQKIKICICIYARFVLTAGHCIPNSTAPQITVILGKHGPQLSKSGFRLNSSGEHDLTTRQESASLRIPAKPSGINKHWRYNAKIGEDQTEQGVWYDFALLELSVLVKTHRPADS